MTEHTLDPEPILQHLVLPALAVRDRFASRARTHLGGGDDGVQRTRLAADDAAAAPFVVTPSIIGPLSAATLILDTLLNAGERRDERYPALFRDYGVFPLARAGMLLAARAVYLLQPRERDVRFGRLLALAREDSARMIDAQEWLGACTCSTAGLSDAVESIIQHRGIAPVEPATDVAVMADASITSAFGAQLVGFYCAFESASRALSEVMDSAVEAPVVVTRASGAHEVCLDAKRTVWLAIAALADLVSIGWHLADRDEDADATAA